LKRGGPLAAGKPLARTGGLVRTVALRAARTVKRHRVQAALPAVAMRGLAARSGGRCEIARDGCTERAVDPAHRKGRKDGGRHGAAKELNNQLVNVLHACRACHTWCHANPAQAKAPGVGWQLEEWQVPADWPVLYRGRLGWLTTDGVLPRPPVAGNVES
jgi:hypothetical protein